MAFLDNIRIRPKLIALFLLIGLLPLLMATVIGIWRSSEAMEQQALDKLEAVEKIKKQQIETYFNERQGDMAVLAEIVRVLEAEGFATLEAVQANKIARLGDYFERIRSQLLTLKDDPYALQAMLDFNRAFEDAGDKVDTSEWRALATRYDQRFQDIAQDNGWSDLYLIHADGDVVYSLRRESDLGMVIPDSALRDSGLGQVYQQARTLDADEIAVADFAPYAPLGGEFTAFMLAPMRDVTGTVQGYVAFQIPIAPINAIVQERTGLGQTGETYLMGQVSDAITYRSDRVIKTGKLGEERAGGATPYIEEALAGKSGLETKVGSTGDLELTAYAPLDLPGLHWAIYSTMALKEVIVPMLAGQDKDLLTRYTEEYGYYDLFLSDAAGNLFYTVMGEADYGTNMVNGKYNNSNLGRLLREVIASKKFGVADFEPYEPSGNAQMAFVAQPIVDSTGAVELVVALQLPYEHINAIMQADEGMGVTGESYLVGRLGNQTAFRSDLEKLGDGKYVIGAAVPPADYIEDAFVRAHKTPSVGVEGTPILVAYEPLNVSGLTWAIIARVDQAEVMAPANELRNILFALGFGVGLLVSAVALYFANSFANPIQLITQGAQRLAVGDATLAGLDWRKIERINARRDEFGDIGKAFAALIGYFKTGANAMQHIAEGDLAVEVTPQDQADVMGHAMVTMKQSIGAMAQDVNRLIEAAVAGRLDTRADARKFSGEYYTIVQGVNDTMDAVIGPLNVAAEYIDRISKGDIPAKITDTYNGDFNEIKINLNLCIDALNALIAEANMLTRAAVEGRLDSRGDVAHFHGAYAEIVRGINGTLDAVIGPLSEASEYVNQIAKGEIPAPITTQYAGDFGILRDNLNILSARLREMIGSLQEAANNLATAAAQILAATTQQATGASEQSASITETTTTVDEVKTISDQAIMRAQEVSDAARRTIEVSRSGRDAVAATIDSMTVIKGRVEGIAENILALSDQTQQIGEITTTVSDIAAQSNMLALNASVEAARAGEHGKGFAVVAMEVRNLAEQSKQATAQVRAILTDIQNAINASVMVTEEGTKVVDDGVRRAAQAREAIEQLSAVIAESAQVSAQVVAGGQQQASGVEQIALAIQNINQAMQQSLASTRQAESAARNLNALAGTLTDTVKQYKVNGNGRR